MPENDGLIPQGWELKRIGDVCRVSGRIGFRGYTVSDIVRRGEGAITISPSNIKDGHTSFAKSTYISWEKWRESPEIQIENGDILLVKTGSTVGKSAVVQGLMEPATINPQLVVLKDSKINSFFLGAVMQGRGIQQQLRETVVGGALPTLSQREIENFVFLCPSRPKEIENLASVLSDLESMQVRIVDLLSKKRDIKQGVMQQLLTGRTRLPGFAKKWEEISFGQLLSYEQPGKYLVFSVEYRPSGTPVLTAGKSFLLGYTNEENGIFRNYPVIIFDDFTTASKYVDFPFKAKSSAMKMLHARPEVDLRFVYELMQITSFEAVDHKRRWITEYSKISMAVPDYEEQKAISSILEQFNSEISLLEQKLAKVKDIKQGIMQQLLTGRVRLPLDQEVKV